MHYIVHGILQARILEWIAFPFPRVSSQPRDWKWVPCIAGGFFTSWATGEAQEHWRGSLSLLQWIFKTEGLNWGLLHCRQILYQLTCQGSPSWYYFYLKDHWIIFQNIFPNFYFFKLWKHNNTFAGDLENTEQNYRQFCYILQLFFSVDELRCLVGVSISNSQKLVVWKQREVEGCSRPEKHYEPI